MEFESFAEAQKVFARKIWWVLGTIYPRRWFILGVTAGMGLAVSLIMFTMDDVYLASSTTTLSAEGRSLAPRRRSVPLAKLLVKTPTNYNRYIAIFKSYSLMDSMVTKFDLVRSYQVAKKENPAIDRLNTIKLLAENMDAEVDEKKDLLILMVSDVNPKKAAEMTNFAVSEVNRRSGKIFGANVTRYRMSIQQRLGSTQHRLDSLNAALTVFQQKYGVFELTTQANTYYKERTDLRLELAKQEVELRILEVSYGVNHPETRAAQQTVDELQEKVREMQAGENALWAVLPDSLPALNRTYTVLQQEIREKESLLMALKPLLEKTGIDEENQVIPLTVLSPAYVPATPVSTQWWLTIPLVMISVFMLMSVYVVATTRLQQHENDYVEQMAQSVRQIESSTLVTKLQKA